MKENEYDRGQIPVSRSRESGVGSLDLWLETEDWRLETSLRGFF